MTLREQKVETMKKIEYQEKIILDLSKWKAGQPVSPSVEKEFGTIYDEEQRDKLVKFLKENIIEIRKMVPDNNKMFLSEIIEKENIKFKSNSLILSPVGSGKTTLIKELKQPVEKEGKILMLVSNLALKNSIVPQNKQVRIENGDSVYTTQDKTFYGDSDKKTHVMSYSEFGNKIRFNDDFLANVSQIFCDEIHSLLDYQLYTDSSNLALSIKYLFGKHENKQIFYFTATPDYLNELEKKNPGVLKNIDVYNYLEHPDIRKYIALSEYKINGLDQIRPHLRARVNSFKYFGYKSIAFNKTIAGQNRIAEIAKDEGFIPLVLWSPNNEEFVMSKEQLAARKVLLETGYIPAPYNFLIINSAMQEGWNLIDDKVKLAIMNTINETEKIQAVGRLRRDLDILVYRVDKKKQPDTFINIDDKYIGVKLTSEDKELFCEELSLTDKNGRLLKWTSVKRKLEKQGFNITDTQSIVDGKRVRVSMITLSV